ncbi:MAG: hypothetical protein ATN34_00955 [Epulopiscium sp. Nele67-Bin002]|nr:MAG: hypothetical protein ATN34_00955 [Epulopiscium sp. Nele67-Bin002]OON94447.1 MAG: hypothetical protein ATN33_04455 [Epulopiscium sp. Nele67-Bin001]
MSINFKLEQFEGPLDLLLFLLHKNKMNIYDIEITAITKQYMQYLGSLPQIELEQMSEFIVMASTLLVIKSRMLLPKMDNDEKEEDDPREELVRKLVEYKKFKYVSEKLDEMQSQSFTYCFRSREIVNDIKVPIEIDILDGVTLGKLYETYQQLIRQQKIGLKLKQNNIVTKILQKDIYSVNEKCNYISELLCTQNEITFYSLCYVDMPKIEFVVTFMGLLELIHKKCVIIEQFSFDGDIKISKGSNYETNRIRK